MTDQRDDSEDWGPMATVLVSALFAALLIAMREDEARRLSVAMDVTLERLDEAGLTPSPLRSALTSARSWWAAASPLLQRLPD